MHTITSRDSTPIAYDVYGDAVAYFMTRLIGMPSIFLIPMRFSKMWKQICPQAPSLPFDMAAVNGFNPPIERMRSITAPTLAIHGTRTFPVLVDSTTLCAKTIPGASHAILPGQGHEVKAEAIAPELVRFFSGASARIAA